MGLSHKTSKMTLKIESKSRLAGLIFLVLLLNSFLAIVSICCLRRFGASNWKRLPHRAVQPPPPPRIQVQTKTNPIVTLSREIEAVLLSGDHHRFAHLIKSAASDALYSYSSRHSGDHFVHVARWNIPVLEALIDANHVDVNRNCILHRAVKSFRNYPDQKEYIETLFRHGADINLPDSSGYPPLVYALQRASLFATEFLLSHGAKINIPFSSYSSILHYAVAIGSPVRMIATLIKNGGNPFNRGQDGLSPFHRVMFLTTSDRDNIMNAFIDTTPATLTDPQLYLKRLLDYPISPTAVPSPTEQTLHGYTPLHLAVGKLYSKQIVQLLLKKGADRNKRENNGYTPLQLAQVIQHSGIIQTLAIQ